MTKEEFLTALDRWDMNEPRFCGGVEFFKVGDDEFVFSAITNGWMPVYLNKSDLIKFINGELNINELEW